MKYSDVDMTPTRSMSKSRSTTRLPPSIHRVASSNGDHGEDDQSENASTETSLSLGCCHNTLALTTNILHIIYATIGTTLLSYAIALSLHKPDPQHGAAIILELYAILFITSSSTGLLGTDPHKPRCKRIPLRMSIQLAPILAGVHCLTALILLVEHNSLWNYITEKKKQFFLSDAAFHFIQNHVHVGMVASIIFLAAVSEVFRYCLLQKLKDRLMARDEQTRRDFLDDRAREASNRTSRTTTTHSQSRSRRRRNWHSSNDDDIDVDRNVNEDENTMTTPLLSDPQGENWAMENVSANTMDQSATSWWEEPETNASSAVEDEQKSKSWFSRAFDKSSSSLPGQQQMDVSISSVDFAPIDADMEMGSRSSLHWSEEGGGAGATMDGADFSFGIDSGIGASRKEPDLSWAVAKDD